MPGEIKLTISKIRDTEIKYTIVYCDYIVLEFNNIKLERIIPDKLRSADWWENARESILALAKKCQYTIDINVEMNDEEKPGDEMLVAGIFQVSRTGWDYDECVSHMVSARNMYHARLLCIFRAPTIDEHPTVWADATPERVWVKRIEPDYDDGKIMSSESRDG